jgi:hypothetical protein
MGQFPAGFDRLLQYADDMIIKATGINMELLGMREVNQPGVLEYQRKQSGMGILASFFDSLKRYRKIQGKGMLKLIQDHLSDGRMVRIVGQDRAQYVPLTKPAVGRHRIRHHRRRCADLAEREGTDVPADVAAPADVQGCDRAAGNRDHRRILAAAGVVCREA